MNIYSVANSVLDWVSMSWVDATGVGAEITVASAKAEVSMYPIGETWPSAALVISTSTAILGLESVAPASARIGA
jgi:hypothetical protein